MYFRNDWSYNDLLVINEAFEHNVYHLKRSLFTGDKVFLDIGANIGAQSLYVSGLAPDARIIAFEPQPENFEILKDNMQLNDKKFELDSRGVWHTPGKSRIVAAGGGSYLDENEGDEIELVTLPQIFRQYKLKEVSVLKVDIEHQNAEKLLLGTPLNILKRCGYICVEFDGYPGSDETLLGKLIKKLAPYFDIKYNGNEKTGGDLWATRKM
jgi:FkbM family methyltransferase